VLNALIVLGLFVNSLITREIATRVHKAAALTRGLNLTAWASAVVGAFIGWVTFKSTGALGYAYDAIVLGAVSATASRL
jgi:hypothetical protein